MMSMMSAVNMMAMMNMVSIINKVISVDMVTTDSRRAKIPNYFITPRSNSILDQLSHRRASAMAVKFPTWLEHQVPRSWLNCFQTIPNITSKNTVNRQ